MFDDDIKFALFEQEAWDYAQSRYNWSATRLNRVQNGLRSAYEAGVRPERVVDQMQIERFREDGP